MKYVINLQCKYGSKFEKTSKLGKIELMYAEKVKIDEIDVKEGRVVRGSDRNISSDKNRNLEECINRY